MTGDETAPSTDGMERSETLPEDYEAYGVVFDADPDAESLMAGEWPGDVTRHVCRIEDGDALCGAETPPDADVFPFRGQPSQIRTGLDECCPNCRAAFIDDRNDATIPATDSTGQIETVGDLDDDDVVYYCGRSSGGPQRAVHLDPACYHLADNPQHRRAKLVFDGRPVCQDCLNEGDRQVPDGADPTATKKQLSELNPSEVGLSPLGDPERSEVTDDV